ncbi:794_t:CDS:1 [Cetraspora pellucida]|uniref:794_t:CDS:1 n=1 Tax=Cetraspora pellucida TaxID=1433469 RepID=A0ACA9KBR5_9GLOM|nr:794_t:CDS:1 [Cetraspora pellucida]
MTTKQIDLLLLENNKNHLIKTLFDEDEKIKLPNNLKRALRYDNLEFIKTHADRSKKRRERLFEIHQKAFTPISYEWLIGDSLETNDLEEALRYAKKFYEDATGTEIIGLAAYTYAKVLIEDEDKRDDAKEKFELSFYEGGYIKAVEKLKEYFDIDIENDYKQKYETIDNDGKRNINGLECFYYVSILLSQKIISDKKLEYIMEILLYGIKYHGDNNCIFLYCHILENNENNVNLKRKFQNEKIKELYKTIFTNLIDHTKRINDKLIKNLKEAKEFKPQDFLNSKSIKDLKIIYKKTKNKSDNEDNEDNEEKTLEGYNFIDFIEKK